MANKDNEEIKLSDDPILNRELHKLSKMIGATPGRKRPRNPEEWKMLKKWEDERGGEKIGDIGPPPPGLENWKSVEQKVRERGKDDSGFTDVNELDGDNL